MFSITKSTLLSSCTTSEHPISEKKVHCTISRSVDLQHQKFTRRKRNEMMTQARVIPHALRIDVSWRFRSLSRAPFSSTHVLNCQSIKRKIRPRHPHGNVFIVRANRIECIIKRSRLTAMQSIRRRSCPLPLTANHETKNIVR